MTTVQVGTAPLHAPPLQPINTERGAGAALKDTVVPWSKSPEQVIPQSMPEGIEVTVPLPIPLFCTVTVKTGTSTTSKATGGPGVRLTPERVPPKILRGGVAALNAEATMVRFGPGGAWILTGITAPLVGFETETRVLAGTDMSGPVMST